jgi:hypothetical protein
VGFIFSIILSLFHIWLPGNHFEPVIKTYTCLLGDTKKNIMVSYYGHVDTTVMINLHDDECTSVLAGQKVLEHTGGILIRIENDSTRNISFMYRKKKYTFDPNRIFTQEGAAASLARFNEQKPVDDTVIKMVRTFADSLLSRIPPAAHTLIALHNNTDSDTASTLSIYSYAPGGSEVNEASKVFINYNHDRDNFFYVTTFPLFSKVTAAGYNALLQKQTGMTNDGSLSVYMALQQKAYVNVEAQHHYVAEQTEMLRALLK